MIGVAATAAAGYLVAALVLFPRPLLPNEREVGRVIGLSVDEARRELEAAGLNAEVEGSEPHAAVPAGLVTWQDPPPGVAVPRGATVTLTLSGGPPRVAVPEVRGLDLDLAHRLILAAGLRVNLVDSLERGDLVPGVAVGTEPAAGDSLLLGSGLVLHLARKAEAP